MCFVLEWGREERLLEFVTGSSLSPIFSALGDSALEMRERETQYFTKVFQRLFEIMGLQKGLLSPTWLLAVLLYTVLWLLIYFHQLSCFMAASDKINWVLCLSLSRSVSAGYRTHCWSVNESKTVASQLSCNLPHNNSCRQDTELQSLAH